MSGRGPGWPRGSFGVYPTYASLGVRHRVSSLIVCHACDLAHRFDKIAAPARVRCARCRAELYRTTDGDIDTAIAWAASALVLFVVANVYPLVALKVNGTTRDATLIGAALGLYLQGYASIAAVVFFTTVLVPLTEIVTYLYVLVPLRVNRRVPGLNVLMRVLTPLRAWGLVEVFMLGALVALVKLAAMATVVPRVALISYGLLMLALAALTYETPTEQFWQWVERSRA
jgi:paraquat-inducible protein A